MNSFFAVVVILIPFLSMLFRPHPKITWYKDGKDIDQLFGNSVRRTMFFTSDSHMELILKPVKLEHEGTYRCVAENSEGQDEKEGFLKVLCEFCYISFFK